MSDMWPNFIVDLARNSVAGLGNSEQEENGPSFCTTLHTSIQNVHQHCYKIHENIGKSG